MEKFIIKRDGRKVKYDRKKIENAIKKSFISVDGKVDEYGERKATTITNYIEELINSTDKLYSVEEIQDLVENGLMNTKRPDVAREYITYRHQRTMFREKKSDSYKEYKKLFEDVGEKITASNVQHQNANIDEFSFGGRAGEAKNVLTKKYALDYIVSPKVKKNHLANRIYIHDLDNYALGDHNCLSVPFDDLLKNGFNTRQADVRPANSVNTAFQLVAVIFQLQSLQQFGGVSATHLDWTMVPYVRKSFRKHYMASWLTDTDEFANLDIMNLLFDEYDEVIGNGMRIHRNRFDDWVDEHKNEFYLKTGLCDADFYLDNKDNLDKKHYQKALYNTILEVQQAAEGMYHNLNTLQSRSGNQLPFTSINYGTCTSTEGRLVTKALLEGVIKGVGALHRTSIFPCGIFQCMRGVNRKPGDPNYDLFRLALKSTSRRIYPNYANVDWSTNAGYDVTDPRTYVSTMGCRTYNGKDANGFGFLKDGRGNIAPSTIILPTLAMEAKEKSEADGTDIVANFMDILNTAIDDCMEGLIERYQYICSQPADAAKFMYENNLMAGYIPEEGIRSALKHGTLAVGNIGLAEALQILIGKNQTTKEGFELAEKIESFMRNKCDEAKKVLRRDDDGYEYYLNWGLYNTPAENLAFTAMTKFKEKYGEIPNVSDKKFFTNSMHVPVWEEIDPFEKIDIESKLGNYSTAGCILYIELDSTVINNIDAIESFVNYAMDHDVPYFALNVPNDTCLECGYTGEFNDCCPQCNSTNIQQLRRVTGYITGNYKTAFNLGKQQEVEMRYQHTKKLKFN